VPTTTEGARTEASRREANQTRHFPPVFLEKCNFIGVIIEG
jgi:hypothetical protein